MISTHMLEVILAEVRGSADWERLPPGCSLDGEPGETTLDITLQWDGETIFTFHLENRPQGLEDALRRVRDDYNKYNMGDDLMLSMARDLVEKEWHLKVTAHTAPAQKALGCYANTSRADFDREKIQPQETYVDADRGPAHVVYMVGNRIERIVSWWGGEMMPPEERKRREDLAKRLVAQIKAEAAE